MNCMQITELKKLANSLVQGARMELILTPKPGLVDLADTGSHPDLSIPIMEQSIELVSDYLDEIVSSLAKGEAFVHQNRIGIEAERRQFDALGTNTHKGYIFLSGMLLIACWHAASTDEHAIRTTLSTMCSRFFSAGEEKHSHGEEARKKFKAGGIVLEAIKGFPSLFEEALPAFRAAMQQHNDFNAASFAMLARLMQTVDDTTTLHRAGPEGLALVRLHGHELEQLIAAGDDYIPYLEELNRTFIRRNITMGGVADMLGLAYGVLIANGEAVAG